MPLKLYQSLPSQGEPLCDTKLYVQNQSVLFDDMIGLPSCSLCTVPFPPAIPVCCCNCYTVSDFTIEYVTMAGGTSAADTLIASIFNPLGGSIGTVLLSKTTPTNNLVAFSSLNGGSELESACFSAIHTGPQDPTPVVCISTKTPFSTGPANPTQITISFMAYVSVDTTTGIVTPIEYVVRVQMIMLGQTAGGSQELASDGFHYSWGWSYGLEYICPVDHFNCTGGVFDLSRVITISNPLFADHTSWGLRSNDRPITINSTVMSDITFTYPGSITLVGSPCD